MIDVWTAQDRQRALIACPVFEVFFGGARGGGKTDGVLGDFLEHAATYGKNAIGLMLRRKRVELIETIERSREIYSPLGWKYSEVKSMWTSRNGARLRFAYLERDADADLYQGQSYTRLYIEEITNFPSEKPVLRLMATLRSAAGVPVGFRATGNPGGPGHHWVKRRYVDAAPQGGVVITDEKTGLQRVFIQSKVADNKYLGAAYIQRIKASGGEALERAWLHGDWSVIEGAFFSEWTSDCIINPFTIPTDWRRFRSMDFGYAVPSSINWWAIVTDDYQHDGKTLPRGALICYREWYTCSGEANTGLRLTARAAP
jgi:Terminase large subunit, T4likevirus-type, N-terminal